VNRPEGGLASGRRRTIVLVAAFAVGSALGAAGWSVFEQAPGRSAVAEQASLLAGPVTWPIEPLGRELTISEAVTSGEINAGVFNLGEGAVTVLAARPAGWLPADGAEHPVVVPPGEWAEVPLLLRPNCAQRPRLELDLTVRTDSGGEHVTLPLPPDGIDLSASHRQVCSEYARRGISLDAVGDVAADGDALRMTIKLRHLGSGDSGDITLTELTANRAGFQGAGVDLPIVLRPDGVAVDVDMLWTVERCDLTDNLVDIPVVVRITRPDFVVRDQPLELPGRGVAALARFSAVACSANSR
jgi:hypothetical protein